MNRVTTAIITATLTLATALATAGSADATPAPSVNRCGGGTLRATEPGRICVQANRHARPDGSLVMDDLLVASYNVGDITPDPAAAGSVKLHAADGSVTYIWGFHAGKSDTYYDVRVPIHTGDYLSIRGSIYENDGTVSHVTIGHVALD